MRYREIKKKKNNNNVNKTVIKGSKFILNQLILLNFISFIFLYIFCFVIIIFIFYSELFIYSFFKIY